MDQQPNKDWIIIKGIIVSNAFAFIMLYLTKWVISLNEDSLQILTFSQFVLIPVVMGIICIYFWKDVSTKLTKVIAFYFSNTVVAILLSAIIMKEGIICLVIVSPLIIGFMLAGFLIGKYLFKEKNKTLNTSTSLLFVMVFVFDTFSVHDFRDVVSDEIVINAPKEVVWKYVASHPYNYNSNEYWLFKIGMPYPVQSTVSSIEVGANRKCIFSDGAIFDETVVEVVKDSLFTFDVIKQPENPEIIGHIKIEQGQFILKENRDGTTTLIGNSWYKLNVYPVWYYNYWAKDITRNVHIRVMEHIKKLAEKDV